MEEAEERRRKTEAMEDRLDEWDVRGWSMLESLVSWWELRDSVLRQGIAMEEVSKRLG